MLKIYNSLHRTKEIFEPIQPGKVKMYVCGPTVYDYAHIGNARTYAVFDVVIRYLKWRGYDVAYVRNITDIDDKIIKRANENQESFQTIVERYTQAIHEDFSALGLLKPDSEPRATEYVPQIISLIKKLIAEGFAYVAQNGDVYYHVRQFANYGELSHRDIDQLESGARVEINDVKRDPLDFVLWKLAKPEEPFWESPWGKGRPGWHIECSAMSMDLLGEHFDIHGGGKDLIFPHHENEIAQSEAVSKIPFVNVWMHAGYLQIEKEKMSKSLGNFFTIRDILKKHRPEVLRYFLVASHYRSPIQFSEQALKQSHQALTRFYNTLNSAILDAENFSNASSKENLKNDEINKEYETKFIEAMDDDFNTPIALSVLFDLAHEIQRLRTTNVTLAAQYAAILKKLAGVLGLLQENPAQFLQSGITDINVSEIENLIAARNEARKNKNWQEADRIRDELLNRSIILEDNAAGTQWKYIPQD